LAESIRRYSRHRFERLEDDEVVEDEYERADEIVEDEVVVVDDYDEAEDDIEVVAKPHHRPTDSERFVNAVAELKRLDIQIKELEKKIEDYEWIGLLYQMKIDQRKLRYKIAEMKGELRRLKSRRARTRITIYLTCVAKKLDVTACQKCPLERSCLIARRLLEKPRLKKVR